MLLKLKKYAVLFAILAVSATLTLAACSDEMTDAEIRTAAGGMGMVMAGQAMMSDADVMAKAKEMGMMTKEEADAMMPAEPAMMGGDRLAQVKERGKVICASRNDVPGYGSIDSSGNNVGFDIDLCRGLAAAVLGDPNAIEIRLISAAERGPTVQSGEVDMLVRTVTWTTSRDSQWGNYAQTMFYDGQGFMVNKELGLMSALELKDASRMRDPGHHHGAEPSRTSPTRTT